MPWFAFLLAAFILPASSAERSVQLRDLPASLHDTLGAIGSNPAAFEEWRERTRRETDERQRQGENEHLVYYLLQSARFTEQLRQEPTSSAREFSQALGEKDREAFLSGTAQPVNKIPLVVKTRMRDFLKVLEKPTGDERLQYFQQFLGRVPAQQRQEYLNREYLRVMRALLSGMNSREQAAGSASTLSQSNQTGGITTDTQVETGYPVALALEAIAEREPKAKLQRVLVVGPGLDFAPRTDLVDVIPPQSYQPYAIADRLLARGLATPDALRIDCIDINERVVRFFRQAAQQNVVTLQLLLSAPDPRVSGYFRTLGDEIGVGRTIGLQKRLDVQAGVAQRITADKVNIVTDRYDDGRQYDLVVITNVLVYFNTRERLSALANITAMLRPGGYIIHNEMSEELATLGNGFGLDTLAKQPLASTLR